MRKNNYDVKYIYIFFLWAGLSGYEIEMAADLDRSQAERTKDVGDMGERKRRVSVHFIP